ncbi:ClpXP adapter SpxH family protein [Bacillus changyiensis]|uniref:ClpXP adapter SpxH family protein n=1 Tax=Bacillus changyiensis TaxID=3004103 RepID=UPI0022DF4FD2|nr:ClpXP adapter SpxH family protein [Bacillus changyiensis]MDA1475906.1 ClpXP adapter SpxH family protein [Bacillus changyiensis]
MTLKQRDQFFSHCHGHPQKPMEIYMFIDPLSAECWALEPAIKKLKIRYGRFFTLRIITACSLSALNFQKRKKHRIKHYWGKTNRWSNISCDQTNSAPYLTSLALKAAELQGRTAGVQFLRNLQESLFLNKQDITDEKVLFHIAERTQLDLAEFKKDLYSQSAVKALQCDLKIAAEMEVTSVPTLTFFNSLHEKEGLKVTGHYSYDIYEEVLFEMLGDEPKPSQTPPLELFVEYFQFVADQEIAVVFDWTLEQVEREMKKLAFAQKVKKINAKHGLFWRYINSGAETEQSM